MAAFKVAKNEADRRKTMSVEFLTRQCPSPLGRKKDFHGSHGALEFQPLGRRRRTAQRTDREAALLGIGEELKFLGD